MNKAIERYKHWKRKYHRSIAIYVLINITIFSMSASTAVLNLWALKYGTDDMVIKTLFVLMAILAALVAFISGIISFFNYKHRKQLAQEKIGLIKNHFEWYNEKKVNLYDTERRNINLLENVTDILNKN